VRPMRTWHCEQLIAWTLGCIDSLHEAIVDFDGAEEEVMQTAQGGVARAEIINGDLQRPCHAANS